MIHPPTTLPGVRPAAAQPIDDDAARRVREPRSHDSLGAFVGEDPRRELRNERELGDFWLGDGFPAPA